MSINYLGSIGGTSHGTKLGYPNIGPQYTMILNMKTPKKVLLIWGNPHMSSWASSLGWWSAVASIRPVKGIRFVDPMALQATFCRHGHETPKYRILTSDFT